MADESSKRRPGDIIIDRCMPNANEAEREAARANLYEFFGVLLRIATRRATEEYGAAIRANGMDALNSGYGPPPSL